MSKSKDDGSIRRGINACKDVFFKSTEGDIQPRGDDFKNGRVNHMVNGSVPNDDDDEVRRRKETDSIPAGNRSERWFERFEEVTQENRKRTMENRNLLMRVDYRTVWIARLLVGVIVTVIGAVIVDALI